MSTQDQTTSDSDDDVSLQRTGPIHILATLTGDQLKPLRDLGCRAQVGIALPYRHPQIYPGLRPIIRFSSNDPFLREHPEIHEYLTAASWGVQTSDAPIQTTSFRDAKGLLDGENGRLFSAAWETCSLLPHSQDWLHGELTGNAAHHDSAVAAALTTVVSQAVLSAVYALPYLERDGATFTQIDHPDPAARERQAGEMINGYTAYSAQCRADQGTLSRYEEQNVFPACYSLVRTIKGNTQTVNRQ